MAFDGCVVWRVQVDALPTGQDDAEWFEGFLLESGLDVVEH